MKSALLAIAALAALLASCSPPPTNGAMQPVDSQTGAQQGGTANPN